MSPLEIQVQQLVQEIIQLKAKLGRRKLCERCGTWFTGTVSQVSSTEAHIDCATCRYKNDAIRLTLQLDELKTYVSNCKNEAIRAATKFLMVKEYIKKLEAAE